MNRGTEIVEKKVREGFFEYAEWKLLEYLRFMKKPYSLFLFLILGILGGFLFCAISTVRNEKDLNDWIGEYNYLELFPHNSGEIYYFIDYTISIYKEGNKYYAQITGDGWFTMDRLLGQVTGDRDKIDITYLQALPEDISYGRYERFDQGEVLWQFERDESGINTIWAAARSFHPTLCDLEGEIIGNYFVVITGDGGEESKGE